MVHEATTRYGKYATAKDIGWTWAGAPHGEIEVRGDDIAGLALTLAKRVCDLPGPGQMLAQRDGAGPHGGRWYHVQ
jgi:hypothetical protein